MYNLLHIQVHRWLEYSIRPEKSSIATVELLPCQLNEPIKDLIPFPLTTRDRKTVMFMTNSNDKSAELLGQEWRRRWSPEQN